MNSLIRFRYFLGDAIFFRIMLAFIPAVLLSCAGQIPPDGGPPDTEPPFVLRTVPDSAAVQVETDHIILEFNEYVDRRSVEESIFISPFVGQLEFDWSGREVEIRFSESLRKERTYVLNIGTDVVDVRARNRMAFAYTLAFSTGDQLDQGAMRGKVFDEKPEGVMMFAFALDGIDRDTLDPSRARPDYITQTGKDGSFSFSNIAWGAYRIMAVRDEYRNLMYDRQVDQFGLTTTDVVLDEDSPWAADLFFKLSAEDTTKPFLARVQPVNNRQLHVRFSEPLDTASFRHSSFAISDTVGNDPVPVRLAVLSTADTTLAIVITRYPLDTLRGYRLRVDGVTDRAGNPIDTANNALTFSGIAMPDTMKPRFTIAGISDSTRNVHVSQAFNLRFSEPVVEASVRTALQLVDSSGVAVAIRHHWINALGVELYPQRPLASAAWYGIRIPGDSLLDLAGNSHRDSIITIRFRTIDLRTTGTIEGNIVDIDTTGKGAIFLNVTETSGQRPYTRTLTMREPAKFLFDQLPEGSYTLSGFRDRDSSGKYDYGMPFPYLPAERFTVYADTLKVRARWGVEGVNVIFK